tara:strand:- start:4871 stop:5212 length:342 start_codon:yes stop_codon:yes gene_type:complete
MNHRNHIKIGLGGGCHWCTEAVFMSLKGVRSVRQGWIASDAKAPERVCPNFWEKQEYDNEIRDMVEDPQIEVNLGSKKYAFIQYFVVNHIDGIKLRSAINGTECPRCKMKYKA